MRSVGAGNFAMAISGGGWLADLLTLFWATL
jgi:hypothetical protein